MNGTIRARISHEVENAMRSGDLIRRDTLRMIQNALYLAERRVSRPISEPEALDVLFREAANRDEAVIVCRETGQREMAEREACEAAIIREFLPEAISTGDLDSLIDETIEATRSRSPRDAARVMQVLAPELFGRTDVRAAAALVVARLAGA